jgi:hypothetical protein
MIMVGVNLATSISLVAEPIAYVRYDNMDMIGIKKNPQHNTRLKKARRHITSAIKYES